MTEINISKHYKNAFDETDPIRYEYNDGPFPTGWYFDNKDKSGAFGPYNTYPEVVWALEAYKEGRL